MDRYNSEKRIQELLDQNALLLMEIQNLKRILAENGIADNNDSDIGEKMIWDPDQGGRIKPEEITRQHAQLFFSRFWGREDVYSNRVVKKNGDVGYLPNVKTSGRTAVFEKPGAVSNARNAE